MNKLGILLCSLVVACGGTITDVDGGGKDGSPDQSTSDGSGSFSCGTSTCSGSEVCVHPCCGGAMICEPLEDGGACPSGMSISQTCPIDAPCTYVCTPPPPYCATAKDCSMVQGHDCYLLCQ